MTLDSQAFRNTLAQWASGVSIVTTRSDEGAQVGTTVSSFTSVSAEPPIVSVCLNQKSFTRTSIEVSGYFAVNILGNNQLRVGQVFAGMFPDVEDRFADFTFESAETGAPILQDALGWLDCKVIQAVEVGSHIVFFGEVQAAHAQEISAEPLLYYHRQWGSFTPNPPQSD